MTTRESARNALEAAHSFIWEEMIVPKVPEDGDYSNRDRYLRKYVQTLETVEHAMRRLASEMDPEKVQYEIAAAGKAKGAQVIASHMNYGLIKVADAKECPKEALAVCRLLGLDERIMALAEEE